MDDPQRASAVEIELTPNGGTRVRRRKSAASGGEVSQDSSSEAVPPDVDARATAENRSLTVAIERRTLVISAAVVVVGAFVLGWAVGRSGGSSGSDQGEAETPAVTAAPDSSALAELPAAVPVRNGPVVRPAPTISFSDWQTETVEVHPALAALGLDVVMVAGNRVAELDTATGELRTLTSSRGFAQPPAVDAGIDWFVVRSLDAKSTLLVPDDAPPVAVPILDVRSAHFEPGTGTFWQAAREYDATAPLGVVELDHEGNATGRGFEVAGGVWPAAPDPAGGIVVSASGGIYHAGPDGMQHLTTGNLVALNAHVALETDCDRNGGVCGMYVVDRASGERTEVVPTDPSSGSIDIRDVRSPAFWSSPELMGAISPDDRWAPMMLVNDRTEFGVIDVTTGRFIALGTDPPTGWWWSPDGRVAIYDQSATLKLFDTQQLTTVAVAPEGVVVEAFAVR